MAGKYGRYETKKGRREEGRKGGKQRIEKECVVDG